MIGRDALLDRSEIARLLAETWERGPSESVWLDVLRDVDDVDAARAAYVRLRDTCERAPTVHTFRETLRSITADRSSTPGCLLCDHTGYVEAAPTQRACDTAVDGITTYSQVRRCLCSTSSTHVSQ